jgi:hypothetical protein
VKTISGEVGEIRLYKCDLERKGDFISRDIFVFFSIQNGANSAAQTLKMGPKI